MTISLQLPGYDVVSHQGARDSLENQTTSVCSIGCKFTLHRLVTLAELCDTKNAKYT